MSIRSALKSLNPWGGKAVNTLDTSPHKKPERPRSSHSNDSRETPPTKRQKTSRYTEVLPRGPEEAIDEFPHQQIQPRGHTYSPSISLSPISSHGSIWNSNTMSEHQGRGDRRRRHKPLGSNKGRSPTEDIPSLFNQGHIVPDSQSQTRFRVKADAADLEIMMGGRSTHLPPAQPTGKKRLSHETHEPDELAMVHTSNNGKKRQPGPSISRRGEIIPTRFSKTEPERYTVSAAVCFREYRYVTAQHGPCFLQATFDGHQSELRAFTREGQPHPVQKWLKITKKIKSLHFHSSSSIIKVSQATDASLDVGHLLIIEFATPQDAESVASWAERVLGVKVLEEDSIKLQKAYDKVQGEVNRTTPRSMPGKATGAGSPGAQPFDAVKAQGIRASISPSQASPSNKPRTTIRGSMQVSEPTTPKPVATYGGRSLRSTQRSTTDATFTPIDVDLSLSPEIPPPPRWSVQNKDWLENWQTPLQFGRVQVTKDDIPRLDEGQYLNDSIIEFGLKYLIEKFDLKHPDLSKRVYMHNSFFYASLTGDGGNQFKYDNVKRWTAKVDLLSYDYIVVPINQHFHWWVAIICNPGKLDPAARQKPEEVAVPVDVEMTDAPEPVRSDVLDVIATEKPESRTLVSAQPKQRKSAYSFDDPRIILLDSLGSGHGPVVKNLRQYLVAEFKDKRNTVLEPTDLPARLGMKAVNIPQQSNLTDCGVYVLGYVQEFVKDPDTFVKALLSKERQEWAFSAPSLREIWRSTLFCEKRRQNNLMSGNREKSLPANSANLNISPSSGLRMATGEGNQSSGETARPVEEASQSADIATHSMKTAAEPMQEPTGHVIEATQPVQMATEYTQEPAGRVLESTEGVQETVPLQKSSPRDFDADMGKRMDLVVSIEDPIEDSPTPEPPQITDLSMISESSISRLPEHTTHVAKPKKRSTSKIAALPVHQSSQVEDDEVVLVPSGHPDSKLFTARISSSPAAPKKAVDMAVEELDAKSFYNKSTTPPGYTKNTKARQPTRQGPVMSQSSPARAPHPKRPDASSPPTGASDSKRPGSGSTPNGASLPKRPGANSPPTVGSQARYFNSTMSPARRQRVATNVAPAYTSMAFAPTREATVTDNLATVKHHEPIHIDSD
ncbi:putative ubiquitin-like-specific protease [Cercophora samala]|uniref:Ubiquitin-like-specific protease n=1 Tax=Cercophora samala TaxID=330535 RepID=A0AA39ZG48_9PEZI|nr:putative ubiquitin-like-specific protease [Cercophora samala]